MRKRTSSIYEKIEQSDNLKRKKFATGLRFLIAEVAVNVGFSAV